MKALLLADLYQAKKHFRWLLPILVIFVAVIAVVSGGSNIILFYSVYAMLLSGLISMNLLAYDEQSKWNIYAQTMPFTRGQQVSEKYLVSLSCTGAVWLLFMALFTVIAARGGSGWGNMLFLSSLLLAAGLLPAAVLLPVVFRFGVTKGRVVYFIVIVVVAAGAGSLGAVVEGGASLPSLTAVPGWLFAVLPLVIAAALFALSWRLAIRWYEKREL